MTRKIVPTAVHIEEAWRHQALVELLEGKHAQYDVAIQHVAAIGPDRWGVRYFCVPKEGAVALNTMHCLAGVELDANGVPSSILWWDLLPDDGGRH